MSWGDLNDPCDTWARCEKCGHYKMYCSCPKPAETTTQLREALEKIANCSPLDLQNPAAPELWQAKARDCIRIAKEALRNEAPAKGGRGDE